MRLDIAALLGPRVCSGTFPTRLVPAEFDLFDQEVLCAAARPSQRDPVRLVVDDSAQTQERFRTCALSAIRREILGWVRVLADCPAHEHRRLEAMATADLLARSDVQCAYRMPPALLRGTRPVVVVQAAVLESVGRAGFLRALWESELAVGIAGSESECGSLFDEFGDRFGVRAAPRAHE